MIRTDELASLLVARSGPLTHEKLVTVYQHVLEHIPHPYDWYSIGYDKKSFLIVPCRRMPAFWWLDEACERSLISASLHTSFSDDTATQVGGFLIAHAERLVQYNVIFRYAPPGVVRGPETPWEYRLSYGYHPAYGVDVAFGVGFNSPLDKNTAARAELFNRVFGLLGLADRVTFAVERAKLKVSAPGLRVRNMAGTPDDPLVVAIVGADDLPNLEARVLRAIAALGRPSQISLACDVRLGKYREFAPAFNTLAEGWAMSVVGRFRPEIEPFSRPDTLPDHVEVEFPLLAWDAHRTKSGTVCLWVAHTRAGACFQATCNTGDMTKLLKKLERKLGITFTPYFDGKAAAAKESQAALTEQ